MAGTQRYAVLKDGELQRYVDMPIGETNVYLEAGETKQLIDDDDIVIEYGDGISPTYTLRNEP